MEEAFADGDSHRKSVVQRSVPVLIVTITMALESWDRVGVDVVCVCRRASDCQRRNIY